MSDLETDLLYVRFRGRLTGPYTPDVFAEMVKRKRVTPMHEVSNGNGVWTRLKDRSDLLPPSRTLARQQAEEEASPSENDGDTAVPLTGEGEDSLESEWYYSAGDARVGPVSESRLRAMIEAGHLGPGTLLWHPGATDWLSVDDAGLAARAPMPTGKARKTTATSSASSGTDHPHGQMPPPWARQANTVRGFLLGSLILGVLVLVPLFVVLSGDVYENTRDEAGELKRWGSLGKGLVVTVAVLWLLFASLLVLYPEVLF